MSSEYPDITAYARALDELMRGEPLTGGASACNHHIKELLERMYDYEAITTRPSHYFSYGGGDKFQYTIGSQDKEDTFRDLRHHPLPKSLTDKIAELRGEDPAQPNRPSLKGYESIYIAGSDPRRRVASPDTLSLAPEGARAIVIPSTGSDPFVAWEMMRLIEDRLTGDPPTSNVPIIVFNEGDYWKHLLGNYAENNPHTDKITQGVQQPFGSQANIFVTGDWKGLERAIKITALKPQPEPNPSPPIIPEGATLLVATKTSEKIYELQAMLKDRNVKVIRLDPIANFTNPEEKSGTFTGNAMEKITEARKALSSAADTDRFDEILALNDIDPDKLFILAEDSGIYLDEPKLLPFMQQTGLLDELGAPADINVFADQFPGVESGPFFNGSLGERTFWDTINKALAMMRIVRDNHEYQYAKDTAAKDPKSPEAQALNALEGMDIAALNERFFPDRPVSEGPLQERFWRKVKRREDRRTAGFLHPPDMIHAQEDGQPLSEADSNGGDLPYRLLDVPPGEHDTRPHVKSTVNSASVLALTPFKPAEPHAEQPVHFFSGINPNSLLQEPKAEGAVAYTGHYLVPSGQPTKALTGEVEKTQHDLGDDYIHKYSARKQAADTLCAALGIELLSGKSKSRGSAQPLKVAISSAKGGELLPAEHLRDKSGLAPLEAVEFCSEDWAANAEAMCGSADAYFLSSPKSAPGTNTLIHDLFRFSSLIVSKQLVPRDKDKTILVDDTHPYWQQFTNLYDELRRTGMAADQQDTFLERLSKNKGAQAPSKTDYIGKLISTAARNLFIHLPHDAKSPEHKGDQSKDENAFNVAVFCSATAKNQPLNDEAFALGEHIARQGHGLVYGAADSEMMGSAFDGFIAGRKAAGTSGKAIGSSTDDIIKVESKDAEAVIDALDVYHDAPHIYERMQFMFEQADAFTIIPGGAGTVQELAALLCGKIDGLEAVKDKPIIIYNQKLTISLDGQMQTRRFYDPLIELIGKDKLAELGVSICETQQEVCDAIDLARHPKVNGVTALSADRIHDSVRNITS